MTTKKITGSYYTPSHISDFIVNYIFKKHSGTNLNILEPSAGDGAFVRSIYSSDLLSEKVNNVTAIELNSNECEKIKGINPTKTLRVKCEDFLSYQQTYKAPEFDIVLGNPPYIKKNLMNEAQIELCQEIHSSYPELSTGVIKNIWSAFLIRSISLLKEDGILSFVLPAELLQVNFTAELRRLLTKEFQRIEIFTFNELIFKECKGQDTLILVAEKTSNTPGLFFHNIEKLDELMSNEFKFITKKSAEDTKWTTHCLLQSEIDLLNRFGSQLLTIDQYCHTKAGIVTGANDYFILDKEKVEKFDLSKHAKPIIKKGGFVSSWLTIDQSNYEMLIQNKIPCYLIDLNKVNINNRTKIHSYLQSGEMADIHTRFKTKIRKKWYEVPNIGIAANALFFKRCHDMPKFIVNEAQLLATDSAYLVNANNGIDIKSLVVSFYNSLTLTFAELYGRFYGGGVLELTPNEFKKLPIPYVEISDDTYSKFIEQVRLEGNMTNIIKQVDNLVLKRFLPNITEEEIETFVRIRQKLVSRRKKM